MLSVRNGVACHLRHVKVFRNFTCINNDFEATVVQQKIGRYYSYCYKQGFTHLFDDFRRCEIFFLSSQSLPIQVNLRKTFAGRR